MIPESDEGITMFRVIGRVTEEPDPAFVAFALLVCFVAASASLRLARHATGHHDKRRPIWISAAALLLTLAVGAVHSVAMGAATVEPTGGIQIVSLAVSKWALPFAAGGGCGLILALPLLTLRRDRLDPGELAAQASRFRALADATFEGLIFERAGRILDANPAICRLLGTDPRALIGRPIATLISGGVSMHPSSLERPTEYELIQQDGGTRPVEVLWRTGPDAGGHVLAIRDISREKSAQWQIQNLAHFDVLTGVGNRQLLEQTLLKILTPPDRLTTSVALLCIDLDRFRAINDTRGPRVGDAILVQVARRLCAVVADADTVARVGGDEFAVIQPLAGHLSDAAALAERIVTELAEPYDVDGQMITVGGSVGVALYPADGTTTLALMTSGALALNRAKRDGRNTWRYCEPGMDYLLRERRALEGDLRIALVEGQLFLAYQPFFHGATLEIAGYEALLRWNHPSRGLIAPADFIPVAEKCGLIVPIGQWVLRTACVEAASWDRPLVVAVNLSPIQFGATIASTVDAVLRETGLRPSLLELEITEGVLIGDTQNALQTLTALKALGVTLAMDDFGTGYSSLSYLKKFPFDKLKIDRSFVRDLDGGSDGNSIVQAIIALSHSLHLEVTAEGVETAYQLAVLRAAGCTFVQGFLLGRPIGAHQIGLPEPAPALPRSDETAIRKPGTTLIPLFQQASLGVNGASPPGNVGQRQGDPEQLSAARSA
jgi:diguanylate cyclase (GGDEF)-like protein/PAS domain S-box-containing protein